MRKTLYLIFPLLTVIILLTGCATSPERAEFALPNPPEKVTLMVPLSGAYADSGKAVRDGFFAAYYYDKQQNTSVPNINIVDTNSGNVRMLYQQAVSQGANFIVGPLLRSNLQAISSFSVPTLGLNWLQANETHQNLYQFGLSPMDETNQVVKKMDADGRTHVLIIVPNNDWGTRIENNFAAQWQALNKNIIGVLKYTSQQALNKNIASLLNVDQAYGNEWQLKQILNQKIRFIPRRRQDFDAIFLAAPPAQAKQIVPLLRFYYVHDIPIYATSSIYDGVPNPHYNRDLDGVMFCDMPWVLLANDQLPPAVAQIRTQLQNLWKQNFNQYPRLYALGVDAYFIVSEFNQLAPSASQGIQGATGALYLTNDRYIVRELVWAKMENGRAIVE